MGHSDTLRRRTKLRGYGFSRRAAALVVVLLALGVAAVLPVGPPKTLAQTLPATLMGERFDNLGFNNFSVQGSTCNPDGTSTIKFSVSGVATGPYPGTFEEQGTVTIGPQTFVAPNIFSNVKIVGVLMEVNATFKIYTDDPNNPTVTGTKHLAQIVNPPDNDGFGQCITVQDNPGTNEYCSQIGRPGSSTVTSKFAGSSFLSYDATIHSQNGTFEDSGMAQFSIQEEDITCAGNGGSLIRGFREIFYASEGVVPLGPAAVRLTPEFAINPVGTDHTVTATVTNVALGPVQGVKVLFTVTGASEASGSCTTDANGQCNFTYRGPELPGADLITGCADSNNNGTVDAGEPCGEATKVFVLPASTPGQVTGGGQIYNVPTSTGVVFGFNAQSDANGIKGECTVIEPSTKTIVKCIDVTALVQTPTHATFFGSAKVNGVATTYRIDVDDITESGAGSDTFKIQTDSGFVRFGVLSQGNIQIHKVIPPTP